LPSEQQVAVEVQDPLPALYDIDAEYVSGLHSDVDRI
jgi:hypothetical protein